MFGYIRPVRRELKCKEFDLYRATYCGLCRTLRRHCGLLEPAFLTYDMTFLAMLLEPPEQRVTPCRGRCMANPFRKEIMCPQSSALELAADMGVVLTYWKLRDSALDEVGMKRLGARALALAVARDYHRTSGRVPDFDRVTQNCLTELAQLEQENCPSLDRTADAFARILQAAAPDGEDSARTRALRLLLYHVGRWIYLLDARDDLEEDKAAGRYNPILARYGGHPEDDALRLTLDNSLSLARSAFEMTDFGCRGPIIGNILYLGMPEVAKAVFDGSWKHYKRNKIWRTTI